MYRLLVACLLMGGCGRFGFGAESHSTDAQGSTTDAVDGPPSAIKWTGSVIARQWGPAVTDTFNVTAHATGNAFLFDLACATTGTVTATTLTAPGWTIQAIDPVTDSGTGYYAASFATIAPNTDPATFTVTWTSTMNCQSNSSELGDEFTGNDPTGGSTTFDAHKQVTGSGNCTTQLTTASANEAIWGSCFADSAVGAPGAGYTKATDDNGGDFTEYKITTDSAGTVETVRFASSSPYTLAAVAIKPR